MDRNHMPVSHIARVSAHSLYANRLEVCMCMGKAYIYINTHILYILFYRYLSTVFAYPVLRPIYEIQRRS